MVYPKILFVANKIDLVGGASRKYDLAAIQGWLHAFVEEYAGQGMRVLVEQEEEKTRELQFGVSG